MFWLKNCWYTRNDPLNNSQKTSNPLQGTINPFLTSSLWKIWAKKWLTAECSPCVLQKVDLSNSLLLCKKEAWFTRNDLGAGCPSSTIPCSYISHLPPTWWLLLLFLSQSINILSTSHHVATMRVTAAVSITHSSHAGVDLVETIISCKIHYIIYVIKVID